MNDEKNDIDQGAGSEHQADEAAAGERDSGAEGIRDGAQNSGDGYGGGEAEAGEVDFICPGCGRWEECLRAAWREVLHGERWKYEAKELELAVGLLIEKTMDTDCTDYAEKTTYNNEQ